MNSLVSPVAALSCLLTIFVACPDASAAARPNILFILADDLGYTDVNTFACHLTGESKDKMFYETPSIDRLAAGGIALKTPDRPHHPDFDRISGLRL